ncbi:MAG: class I SAM-dependent methyltransferase [Myxococcaceae bacterium]|nr:MAG: class I SAM-dependent methyltransferase [Myxococcaceae bacterium]
MGITMSQHEYATAFRLLTVGARHPENIAKLVEERLLPGMPAQPTLLDVGAGSGKVAERLATHFGKLTLLEPNPEQIAGFHHAKATIHHESLARFDSQDTYAFVVCSHVLYHVPVAEWAAFIDRLLSFVRPGGWCVIAMAAARGPTYELCKDFSRTLLFSEAVTEEVQRMRLPHEVIPTMSGFVARTFEEMYTLCRFLVLEGCFTAAQLAGLDAAQARELDAKIREHAERCRDADGVYRLAQDEDLILIPRT